MKTMRLFSSLALGLALILLFAGCAGPATPAGAPAAAGKPANAQVASPAFPVLPVTQLKVDDLQVGTGAEAVDGKKVSVQYTGWLVDGTKFDSCMIGTSPSRLRWAGAR